MGESDLHDLQLAFPRPELPSRGLPDAATLNGIRMLPLRPWVNPLYFFGFLDICNWDDSSRQLSSTK